jgi:hypothetical protein
MSTKSDGVRESPDAAFRKLLRTIANTLQITDLTALMTVFATALNAHATWKTTRITNEILLTSQRPYVGTVSIKLIGATSPRVVVELRNFGSVRAKPAVISIALMLNGKELPLDSESQRQQAPGCTVTSGISRQGRSGG